MNKNILADEIRVLGEGKNIECLVKNGGNDMPIAPYHSVCRTLEIRNTIYPQCVQEGLVRRRFAKSARYGT